MELHLHTKASKADSKTGAYEYINKAMADFQAAMAITDFESTEAFAEISRINMKGFRLLYGLEFSMQSGEHSYHVTALAKDQKGMEALDLLTSGEKVTKSGLTKLREGLLIGSACDEGELYQALICQKEGKDLEMLAAFYDYIEVQPVDNFAFLIEQGKVRDRQMLVEYTKQLIDLGFYLGIPVVAVGDVCFLDRKDFTVREALLKSQGVYGEYAKAPLYFRTTREMLNEFSFLDEDTACDIVIRNPNKIARLCKEFIYE